MNPLPLTTTCAHPSKLYDQKRWDNHNQVKVAGGRPQGPALLFRYLALVIVDEVDGTAVLQPHTFTKVRPLQARGFQVHLLQVLCYQTHLPQVLCYQTHLPQIQCFQTHRHLVAMAVRAALQHVAILANKKLDPIEGDEV